MLKRKPDTLDTVTDKVKILIGSVRFWMLTLSAIVAILESYVTNGAILLPDFFEIVKIWLVAVVGVGTLDSIALKINKKE